MPDDTSGYFRVPGWLRQQAGLGRIGVDARAPARTAYGLAIENVERAHLWHQRTGASNYTSLGATSWTALDSTNLAWRLWVSGRRPIEFSLTGSIVSGSLKTVGLSVAWDGVEVTGTTNGMLIAYDVTTYQHRSGGFVLDPVTGGEHTVTIVYRVSGGVGGGVQVDADARLFVSVKEI